LFAARRLPTWTPSSLVNRLILTAGILLCFSLPALAAPSPLIDTASARKNLEFQARAAQKQGNWLVAVRLYDEAFHNRDKEKISPELRQAYQECLRRYHLQRRLNDRMYRDALATLNWREARDILSQVLVTLSKHYYDRQKIEPAVLFQNGIQELLYALDDEAFTRTYLGTIDQKRLQPLRDKLNDLKKDGIKNQADLKWNDASIKVMDLAQQAQTAGLSTNPNRTIVVFLLEFACGACNGLDEYSLYLTPFYINAMRGKYVGVGIDLAITGQNLEVSRVYPSSPAEEQGLLPGDRIRKINSEAIENLTPDAVAERLLGEPDTLVELEVVRGEVELLKIKLVRRAAVVPSVEHHMIGEMGSPEYIGYIRINHFEESTAQDVKEALAQLQTAGMKALILDLRGNPGGLFKASVQVSELFLGDGGVIVLTRGQLKEFNRPYKAEAGNPFAAPMVVLVDGDTASAAEVLAGALKDNERAKLIGQTTFGKCTIQQIIPLERSFGGIRITVGKFTSPLKNNVGGVGITPNIVVIDTANYTALNAAVNEVRILLGKPAAMPMSPDMMMNPMQ
jgi:carboxyl-terminal processing protease